MSACPICGKDDRTNSLRGVFARPYVISRYYDHVQENETSREIVDPLTTLLKQPDEVKPAEILTLASAIFIWIVLAIIPCGFAISAAMKMSEPTQPLMGEPNPLPILGCASIFIAGATLVAYKMYANREKDYALAVQKHKDYLAAIDKWSRSYYCDRDFVVFDPETGDYCDPYEFQQYLKRDKHPDD